MSWRAVFEPSSSMGLLSHIKASGECERLRLPRKEISEKVQKSLITPISKRLHRYENIEKSSKSA